MTATHAGDGDVPIVTTGQAIVDPWEFGPRIVEVFHVERSAMWIEGGPGERSAGRIPIVRQPRVSVLHQGQSSTMRTSSCGASTGPGGGRS